MPATQIITDDDYLDDQLLPALIARPALDSRYGRLAAANVFTADQTISKTNPRTLLINPAGTTGRKALRIQLDTSGILAFQWLTDDGTTFASNIFYVDSSGAVRLDAAPAVKVPNATEDTHALNRQTADTRYGMTGTGSPEGVVTAPVGTRYTDTAITNGAWEWQKKTGTGNTGWVVVTGDTGWRDVGSLVVNGWAVSVIRLRRVGSAVSMAVEALDWTGRTSDIFMNVPSGFQSLVTFRGEAHTLSVSGVVRRGYVSSVSSVVSSTDPGGVMYFTWNWQTVDAWPSALPGTAI